MKTFWRFGALSRARVGIAGGPVSRQESENEMRLTLYANGNKVRFWGNLGWYPGEPFILFKIEFMSQVVAENNDYTVFGIQIAKFSIGFGFDLVKEK